MKNTSLFSVLTKEDRGFLQEHMEMKKYEKGEIIFTPLDRCDHLSMVMEGQVKLCKYSADGKEYILSFLETDDVFGEAIVFDGNYYPVTIVVEQSCKIGMVHREVLLALTQRNKEFTQAFFRELTRKIMLLNNKVEMLSLKSIKQKIAQFLLNLSQDQGEMLVKLPHSKQKIAFLLGTSREVISRNFSELENEGIITPRGKNHFHIHKKMLEDLLLM